MVLLKFNPHVVIFFSLVIFLLLRQSISEHENAPIELLKDSKDSPSRKIDLSGHESNEEEKYDSSNYLKKMTKKKESEKDEKEEKKKEHEKEKMKDKKEEEEEDEKEKMKEKKVKTEESDKGKTKDKKEEEEEDKKEKMKDKKEEKEKDDDDNKDKKKKKKEEEEEDEEEGDKDKKKKTKESGDEKDNKSFSSTSMSSSSTSFDSIESILYLTNALKKNPTIPSKIKQGCKKADFPNECEATLLSLGKDTKKLDPPGIFKTSAKALTQALNVAKTSVLDPDMGVSAKGASVCEEVYQDALEALKDGMEATAENDRYMASLKLSTVVTDVDTCQDGIGRDGKSKLAKLNVVLSKLAANTISLGDVAGYVYNNK